MLNSISFILHHASTFCHGIILTYVKGPKSKHTLFCHLLLTWMWLQTCMSFFLRQNTKEDILKNDWNQTVLWHH